MYGFLASIAAASARIESTRSSLFSARASWSEDTVRAISTAITLKLSASCPSSLRDVTGTLREKSPWATAVLTSARWRKGEVMRRATSTPASVASNPVAIASNAVFSAMLRTAANATLTSRAVTTAHGGSSTGHREPRTSSFADRSGSR